MDAVQSTESKFLVSILDTDNAVREVFVIGRHEDGKRLIVKEKYSPVEQTVAESDLFDSSSRAETAQRLRREKAIADLKRQLAQLERIHARKSQVR